MHRFFFTNSRFMEFQVRYLALFHLEWFWIGSLQKDIQSVLEFLKAPLLVLHFSCYILMTLQMMLCVILLSMLMILLCTLYHQSFDFWLELELASELESDLELTFLDWDRKWQIVLFGWSNNFGAIDMKINRSAVEEKSFLR